MGVASGSISMSSAFGIHSTTLSIWQPSLIQHPLYKGYSAYFPTPVHVHAYTETSSLIIN